MARKRKDAVEVLKAAIKDFEDCGISQCAIARRAGILPEQVYRLMKKQRMIGFDTAAKLMVVLGLEIRKRK
jgi:plasmid maintenance system antidote protein VapI